MRSGKSLLVLVIVFAGLLGYLYFVDAKKPVESEGSPSHDKVFSVDAAKIDEVTIHSTSGDTAVARKEKDGWHLTEPADAKADENELSGLTSTLGSLEVTSVVDDHPKDVAQYGLEPARLSISFRAQGDKAAHTLLLGEKTPTGGDLYAQLAGEPKVFLVPAYVESSLDRKPFDLREKSVLKFDRDKADRLHLVHDGVTIDLEKSNLDWRMTAPVAARADFGAVEGVITRLQSAQMTSIASPTADDLKKFGLDPPAVTATVGAGSSQATLLIGSAVTEPGKEGVYAKDGSRPMVFVVGKDLADDLKKGADDFRRKDVFEFRSYNTKRLDIARDGQTFTFEKAKGAGPNGTDRWRRTSPTTGDVDSGKMETLLSKLSTLRAQSFVADTSKLPRTPTMKVSAVLDENNKQEQVSFTRSGSDVYAVRSDEPGAMRLTASDVDEALKALDAVK